MAIQKSEFHQIIELYNKELYWFARTVLYCHEDANDCIQDSFIKAWKSFHQLKKADSVKSWLYQIVRNTALDKLRRQRKGKIVELIEEELEVKSNSGLELNNELIMRKLELELEKLTEAQQAIFRLRYYSEYSFKQISEIMQSTENSVKASYSKTKKGLTKQILEWEL